MFCIIIDPNTTVHRTAASPNTAFLCDNKLPIVLFKPDKPHPSLISFKFPGLENYPPGLVPITSVTCTFNLWISVGSQQEKYTITRHQLPISLNYAFSDYKSQSRTFEKAIIDLRCPSGFRDANSAYVCLSRLKSLQGLLILRDFKESDLNAPLPENLLSELRRIEQLNETTLEDFDIRDLGKDLWED